MYRRHYDSTPEDQRLAAIAAKKKRERELTDAELEGLDVFDPENPPQAEPRPLPEGIISDSGWSEPGRGAKPGMMDLSGAQNRANAPENTWDRTRIDAPMAPGLRAKQQGYQESDLPEVLPVPEGSQNFRGPPRPGAPGPVDDAALGMPTFADKPDSEQYLDSSQKKALKDKLYAVLADKMQRRAKITGSGAYDAATRDLAEQRELSVAGNFLGAMSKGASMAGQVGGKRADATIIPEMYKGVNDSTQDMLNGMLKLRGLEEVSNMNDLDVAKYISGLENADSLRQIKVRELYDRAAARRLQKRPGGKEEWERRLAERGQDERERNNRAREKIAGEKPGARSSYDAAGSDDEGLLYVNKSDPTDTKRVPVGKGFKPKTGTATTKETLESKTQADLVRQFSKDYASKSSYASSLENNLAILKKYMDRGDDGAALNHARTMLKDLNSSSNPDAIGAEEANRLGQYLATVQAPWEDGSMFGADLDRFYQQVQGKSKSMRGSAQEAFNTAKIIREKGLNGLDELSQKKTLTESDHKRMAEWARDNPDNPTAKKILEAQKKLNPGG